MPRFGSFKVLAFGILVLGCSDIGRHDPLAVLPTAISSEQVQQNLSGVDAEFAALEKQVPGFAGAFKTEEALVVLVKGGQLDAAGRAILEEHFASRGDQVPASPIIVRPGIYSWSELTYLREIAADVFSVGGTFIDINEATNRIEIGVGRSVLIQQMTEYLVKRGLSLSAFAIVVQPTISQDNCFGDINLQCRPLIAGLQISYVRGADTPLCTMAWVVTYNSQRAFLTASHCTPSQSGVDPSFVMYQHNVTVGRRIGAEYMDEMPHSAPAVCGSNPCRWTDVALIAVDDTVEAYVGGLAIGDFWDSSSGTFEFYHTQPMFSQVDPLQGYEVHKWGRSTGHQFGTIDQTCVTVGQLGTNIRFRCQSRATRTGYPIEQSGDSGGPVFTYYLGHPSGTVRGVAWGGCGSSACSQFYLTPPSGINNAYPGLVWTP